MKNLKGQVCHRITYLATGSQYPHGEHEGEDEFVALEEAPLDVDVDLEGEVVDNGRDSLGWQRGLLAGVDGSLVQPAELQQTRSSVNLAMIDAASLGYDKDSRASNLMLTAEYLIASRESTKPAIHVTMSASPGLFWSRKEIRKNLQMWTHINLLLLSACSALLASAKHLKDPVGIPCGVRVMESLPAAGRSGTCSSRPRSLR